MGTHKAYRKSPVVEHYRYKQNLVKRKSKTAVELPKVNFVRLLMTRIGIPLSLIALVILLILL